MNYSENNIQTLNSNEWKYINHTNILPNSYLINEDGLIFSKLTNKFVKPFNTRGYIRCKLVTNSKNHVRKNFGIHQLVLRTFLSNPPKNMKNPTVDHIDKNTKNNNIHNLRWMENYDNSRRDKYGTMNKNSKINAQIVHLICQEICKGKTNVEIGNVFDISPNTVSMIRNCKSWFKISEKYFIFPENKFDPLKKYPKTTGILLDILSTGINLYEFRNKNKKYNRLFLTSLFYRYNRFNWNNDFLFDINSINNDSDYSYFK